LWLFASQAQFFPVYRAATVRFLWMLIAVTAVLLTVACFNLAALLLARAEARRCEMATRQAVGASTLQLFQQLTTENIILAGCSCALSLPLALIVTRWMRGVPAIHGLQISMDMNLDSRALGLAMLAGLASGLAANVSACHHSGWEPAAGAPCRSAVKDGARRGAGAACAMTVLVGAVLLARTMHHLRAAPLGFNPRDVLLASLDLYSASVPRDHEDRIIRSLLAEVRASAPEAAITTDNVIPSAVRTTLDVGACLGSWIRALAAACVPSRL
jgi:hypothetical protein